ncbi:TPA: DUF551 domain-containing protein [Klebsiella aerogenes]|nr:DUF551 domain-containing protein [Klebsiella aerogenes]
MSKSTITRERLQEITEDGFLKHGESKELALMALAAMDSEPVVPEEIPGSIYEVIYQECGGFVDCDANAQTIWNACRAAMLQAQPSDDGEPTDDERIMDIEGIIPPISAGNSPAQGPIDHGYRPGCECSGCKTTVRICAELAGWIPVSEQMPGRYYVLAADYSGRHYPPSQPNTQVGIHDDWFGDGKPTWDDGDGNDLHLKQVTHWMPLPAAPQEVK